MKQSVVYIGVDVAKAHLDVAWEERSRRFDNDKKGRAALVAWIKQSATAVQLICEASGGYEQALLKCSEQSELKVTLVQANRVRQYARAAGILSKTDKIDARVLSAFGAAMQPPPTRLHSAEQKRLREYEGHRRHLSALLVAEQNRLEQLGCAELRVLSRSLINKIKKQIATIDARIASLIAQDQELCVKAQKPLRAWVRARRHYSWRKCPNWVSSIGVKLQLLVASHRLTAIAALYAANAPSSVDGARSVVASTWRRWPPLVTTKSSPTFISVCAPKVNLTNSL
jgi:transposase